MTRLRVAIIGLGVGETHVKGWEAHPGCTVTTLCDIDPLKLAEVGGRHPGKRLSTNPAEVLADPDIDAVSIASYDDAHHAQVTAAIDAGKHIFAEKPLCLTDAEWLDIRDRLRANPRCRMSSNLILRTSPRFVQLKADIVSGRFGSLYMVEGDYNYGRFHKILSGWRGESPSYSVVHGGAIHLVDLMQWLVGEPVVEVAAAGADMAARMAGKTINDTVVSILRFAGGAVGKVSANFACIYPHFHRLSVYGTAATFENGLDHALMFDSSDPARRPEEVHSAYPGVHKGDLIPSFAASILGEGEALVSAEDTLSSMATCLAIERSLRSGRFERVTAPDAN